MKIYVNVKPNSGKQKIEKISENEFKLSLKSVPENNKANIELLKLMKKHFGKDFKILKGRTSRKKILGAND